MSQVSIIDIEGTHPQIPTEFIANTGTAIPIANSLEIYGDTEVAGTTPVFTVGLGNNITTYVRLSQSIAAADVSKVGLSNFDSSAFTVDADGFVTLNGGGGATTKLIVDTSTIPGTNPVVPTGAGVITVTGAQVASGTVGANVIRSNSLAANTMVLQIQRSTAIGASNSIYNGVAHFDSTSFSVDGNGFVQLSGGGQAIDSIHPDSGTDPVVPTAGGLVNILGTTAAAGTAPLTTVGSLNTLTITAQRSQALAAQDSTKVGLSNFDSSMFSVDANGFVTLVASASFTTGSVIFWGASSFAQDNANFFWDDTNNRLGIGTNTPLDTLHVVGSMELDHTASENDDHALEIVCNANGFSDVKAVDIDYITGAMGAGQDEEAILVNIDETASTGGIIAGYLVLSTAEGLATVNGYETGINVNPIVQESGIFGNADYIRNIAVDVTAALASGGVGGVTAFVADNDTFTIGEPATFDEVEVILTTPASGGGIAPTFEYSTGAATFAAFVPADGTNGFRNTGAILWDSSTLVGWVAAASGNFEIRITRTRNVLSTSPVIDEIQVSSTTEFKWDKNGDVNINSLTLVVPLTVPNGGTGNSSLTDHGIMLGSGAGAVTVTAAPTDGQLLIGSTGVDPVLATLTAGSGVSIVNGAGSITLSVATSGMTWTDVTGATQALAVNNGYFTDRGGGVTYTLPATAVLGDIIKIDGKLGLTTIAQNANQSIRFSSTITTVGVGGSAVGTNLGDCVTLRCSTAGASTVWIAENFVGNWTIT